MPNLDRIVRVNVNRTTAPIRQQGFSDVLVFTLNTRPSSITSDFATYTELPEASIFPANSEEAKFISRYFGQGTNPSRLHVGFSLPSDADVGAGLTRVANSLGDSNFYAVCIVGSTVDKASKIEVGSWASANQKLAILQDFDPDTLLPATTDDLASELENASNDRAMVWWTGAEDDYIDAAVAGVLSNPVGLFTFAYQQLNGVPVSPLITATSSQALDSKNANYYVHVAGQNRTFNGLVSSGDFADVIVSQDYLKARLQENTSNLVINALKIPYTDTGIERIASACSDVLNTAVLDNVISNFTLSTRSLSQIPPNDRANRRLGSININATVSGAIHSVVMNLELRV